jgi:hypothetical protein
MVLRLNIENDGTAELTTKVTSGDGVVLLNKTDKITEAEVEKFYQVVKRSNFWQLPSSEPEEVRFLDGTRWALEAIHDGTYHMVYRSNPAPSLYTEVGRYLAKNLAKLDDSMVHIREYPY